MRYSATQVPSRDPRPKHSLKATARGTVAAAVLVPLLALVALYPVVAAAAVGFALATWPLVREARRLYRARRRQGRTRHVCAPKMDVCVEV